MIEEYMLHQMIDNSIDYRMRQKIIGLKYDDLSGFQSHEFFGNDGKLLNYVLDNLNCFHSHYEVDVDEFEENHLFYWEVIDDPIIPYIIGITPEFYRKTVIQNQKGYITLHYYWNADGIERWYLHFFHLE
ncbi:hypothetical protein J7I80_05845 [Bacillus sp. ISL-41]|uniref:hypothetical protein n=1 Tax=Bacillus sp. ISL-41 TaxID=2819127 RepID=UPI001BEC3AD3|nr:hypothetical protein [Bacillus sp. ISL-41]MBT2641738.1 hypothetical protein [Bacillus sp. ISL-41]